MATINFMRNIPLWLVLRFDTVARAEANENYQDSATDVDNICDTNSTYLAISFEDAKACADEWTDDADDGVAVICELNPTTGVRRELSYTTLPRGKGARKPLPAIESITPDATAPRGRRLGLGAE